VQIISCRSSSLSDKDDGLILQYLSFLNPLKLSVSLKFQGSTGNKDFDNEKFLKYLKYFQEASKNPLFICGDSHCLSPAWSIINVAGFPRLLYPKLTTGVKQWHLRKESNFYPKANFQHIINTIPQGSEVTCGFFLLL
jgi:hypothetical protein